MSYVHDECFAEKAVMDISTDVRIPAFTAREPHEFITFLFTFNLLWMMNLPQLS